jgi:cytochrome c oxidase assembly protein subunit 15
VLALLAWQLNRLAAWRVHSRVLAALVGLQLATGLSNVVFDWPLLAALLHTGGSAALVLTLTWISASAVSVKTGNAATVPGSHATLPGAQPESRGLA